MTQFPPSSQLNYEYPGYQRQTSGTAIASLVLGIFGCIPLVTGILAIVLGAIALRRTRDPMVGGRGLASAGLVLGIVSVLGCCTIGGLVGIAYEDSQPAKTVAWQFLQDVSAGRTNAAMANSTGFTSAALQSQTQKLAAYGTLNLINLDLLHRSTSNGFTTMRLDGTVMFSSGARNCTFYLVKINGAYKVTGFWVQ